MGRVLVVVGLASYAAVPMFNRCSCSDVGDCLRLASLFPVVAPTAGTRRAPLATPASMRVIGIGPKTAARIFRFERACRLIRDARLRLADVAAVRGYHDQPHMTREWIALAGCTPRTWIATELLSYKTT